MRINELNIQYLVITDLDKKMEEAKHDALVFFDKKCAYCSNDMFSGHIRTKLEFDHFWPIAKGGQDIMWNILPVCKVCNRKKSAKLPNEFNKDRFEILSEYLSNVRKKYNVSLENDLQQFTMIKKLFENGKPNIDDIKVILGLKVEENPESSPLGVDYETMINDLFEYEQNYILTNNELMKDIEPWKEDYGFDSKNSFHKSELNSFLESKGIKIIRKRIKGAFCRIFKGLKPKETETEHNKGDIVNIEEVIDKIFDWNTPKIKPISRQKLWNIYNNYCGFESFNTVSLEEYRNSVIKLLKTEKYRVKYESRSNQHKFYMPSLKDEWIKLIND